jgi:hypothetical protein
MGWIAAAVAVIGAVSADRRASKVAKAQKEEAATQRAIEGERSAREKRVQRAKAMVARAEIESQAASGGMTASSAAISAKQGVTSQLSENIAEINTRQLESGLMASAAQKTAKAGRVSLGSALVEGMGQQGAAAAGRKLFD